MAKIVTGMAMSLDGFMQDANGSSAALSTGEADFRNTERGKACIAATGAVMMGRKTFEMADAPDLYAGNYEFQVPVFVLTRNPPTKHPKEGSGLTFTFVQDGLDSAIAQAKAAAGSKQVTVVGGPSLIQALLQKGAVDELEIDLAPVLLGGGRRLFDNLDKEIAFETTSMDPLPLGGIALRFSARLAAAKQVKVPVVG
jgi:dihydrofolate reductase